MVGVSGVSPPPPADSPELQELTNLVSSFYGQRSGGNTLASESSEDHGAVLIRESSLQSAKGGDLWGAPAHREASFGGSEASGSTSGVPRSATDGTLGSDLDGRVLTYGGGLAAVRALHDGAAPPPGAPGRASPSFAADGVGGGFFGSYELGEAIGAGASSTVYRASRRRDGEAFAVKVLRVARGDARSIADAREEVAILRLAASMPGVVRLVDARYDGGCLRLVQELARGGELFEAIARGDRYDEREAAAVARNVLAALAALHAAGIVHRDVKLENVLLRTEYSRTETVLADLGIAVRIGPGRERAADYAGSVHYLSPEIVRRRPYGAKTDVWSLGVTCCALLCGRLPFIGASNAQLFDVIDHGRLDFTTAEWRRVSEGGRAFAARALSRDSADRPSAAALLDDPWLSEDNAPVDLEANLPTLRALLSWRRTWRRSIHAVRAVNILASPASAFRTIASAAEAELAPLPLAPPVRDGEVFPGDSRPSPVPGALAPATPPPYAVVIRALSPEPDT